MKILDQFISKVRATIPIDLQIQGAHCYHKVRLWLFKGATSPVFQELRLPDVDEVSLEKIDFSSPFLFRQN
ncbi:hypothetical protein, partial [Undibacterium luofuense]